jgi:hypothetical protein
LFKKLVIMSNSENGSSLSAKDKQLLSSLSTESSGGGDKGITKDIEDGAHLINRLAKKLGFDKVDANSLKAVTKYLLDNGVPTAAVKLALAGYYYVYEGKSLIDSASAAQKIIDAAQTERGKSSDKSAETKSENASSGISSDVGVALVNSTLTRLNLSDLNSSNLETVAQKMKEAGLSEQQVKEALTAYNAANGNSLSAEQIATVATATSEKQLASAGNSNQSQR